MNKKIILIVSALALCLSTAVYAAGELHSGHSLAPLAAAYQKEGTKCSEHLPRMQFMSYVAGVHDSYVGSAFCTPPSIKVGQAATIVANYIVANPALWHVTGSTIVGLALGATFPCPTKP
jgi:hypothetical protein